MSSTARRLVIAALLLIAVACIRLALWQIGRLHQRRAENAVAAAGRAAPPVALDRTVLARPEAYVQRRLIAAGRYDQAHEIVLRGEALEGVPGVHLVTPLLLAGSETAVLVDRGFVPAPDAVTVRTDLLAEPGPVRVEGLALPIPSGGGRPLAHRGHTTWARLDLAALRLRLPYPILPIYLRQLPDPSLPSFPRRLAPLPLDEGPHLSYAVQWFFFAGLAVLFAVLVVARGRRSNGA